MSSTPDLSVVICSLNGAPGVDRCLAALSRQTLDGWIEAIVVDDGSTDDTSGVAHRHGARVVRHQTNKGLSAARNSGVLAASSEIVAFLDDDCEPRPDWARCILASHGDGVIGVGGPVVPQGGDGPLARYLERHNPLEPLEIELSTSESLPYRLLVYLRGLWTDTHDGGRRPVYSLVGANMSYRRDLLLECGLFDERFTFGAEELDLCRRLSHAYSEDGYVFEPKAEVVHHFDPSLRDTLRRSRAYGRGSARMFRKWPSSRPTFFPFPLAVGGLLALGLVKRKPKLLAAAALAPQAMFPGGIRHCFHVPGYGSLLDPYVQLAQETMGDIGFLQGLWMFRNLEPENEEPSLRRRTTAATESPDETRTLIHAS
jgi:glycosyltransferase involved in cell wall biosynthesis